MIAIKQGLLISGVGLNLCIFNLAIPLGVNGISCAQQTSKDRGTDVTSQAWEVRHLKAMPGPLVRHLPDGSLLRRSVSRQSQILLWDYKPNRNKSLAHSHHEWYNSQLLRHWANEKQDAENSDDAPSVVRTLWKSSKEVEVGHESESGTPGQKQHDLAFCFVWAHGAHVCLMECLPYRHFCSQLKHLLDKIRASQNIAGYSEDVHKLLPRTESRQVTMTFFSLVLTENGEICIFLLHIH